ncbi:MAG: leucine rich repeat scaffold protein [Pseudomonadota bacterium]
MQTKHSNFGFAEFLLSSEEDTTVSGRSASWIALFDSELDDWITESGVSREEKRAEAAAKIATCRDHNLTRLDLSRLGLSSLPNCVGELRQLEWLLLVSNHFTTLPAWVCALPDLVGLYLSCNRLNALPDSIGDLNRLERLRLDYNQLEKLPASIANLRALKQISLGHNRIEALPEALWLLPSLDAETLFTLPRMEQENRIAYLEHKAKNVSSMLQETQQVEQEALSTIEPSESPAETPVPTTGLMGLLALQRVQLEGETLALRDEIDSLKTELAVQNALYG